MIKLKKMKLMKLTKQTPIIINPLIKQSPIMAVSKTIKGKVNSITKLKT